MTTARNAAFLLLLLTSSGLARGQEPMQVDTAVEESEIGAAAQPADKKSVNWLYAPVPFSGPSTGPGIGVGVAAFYNPNGGPHQWVTGGGVIWTKRGSRALAVLHKMSTADDRLRFQALLGWANQERNYYGIGEESGDRGDALILADKGVKLRARAIAKAFNSAYFGVQYVLETHNARLEEEADAPTVASPPADELNSRLSMVGPVFLYDTRNNQDETLRGFLLNASLLFGRSFTGDSFKHTKLSIALSTYQSLSENTVLAGRGALCSVSGDVPYYDLCRFGSNADLRGYPAGRYRDEASWAVQGEIRHRLTARWAATAFVGLGGIAPSVGGFIKDGNLLPAAGAGVRYRPFKDNKVQLRVDFAVGKGTRGFYLGVGEAF